MSAVFPEYKELNLSKIAENMLSYWEDNHIFQKSISSRDGGKSHMFF